ncbi:MAG: pirin family protein [Thermodesulfobacteriota bacterium]
MINIRKSNERGNVDFGWLKSCHTFSFGNYYDPKYMGFGKLRVINEDWVKGGQGFGSHPHRDMEIITYVMEGALEHKDSMGNSSTINKNDFQKMSAGTGVVHSEYNNSESRPVHLYQIWILPEKTGINPDYQQLNIDKDSIAGNLKLIASGNSVDENVISINQDADIYIGSLKNGTTFRYENKTARDIWIQVTKGTAKISERVLDEGDGASISGENEIIIETNSFGEILLFDMIQ